MADHTPGPWRIAKSAESFGIKEVSEHSDLGFHREIAHIDPEDWENIEEAQANAQLMATAPELLEAIERLHTTMTAVPASNWLHLDPAAGEEIDEALELAYAAITKAKGGEKR